MGVCRLGTCKVSLRGDGHITTDVSIAGYLHGIVSGRESADRLGDIIHRCDLKKLRLLWEILFETEIYDLELLEERIYAYGSVLKEQDLLEREIFVILVSVLNQLKIE